MTDMPEFRAWADRAFRSSMEPHGRTRKRPTRYKCVNSSCDSGTTRNQAQANGCTCRTCGSDLISKAKLDSEFGRRVRA